MSCVIYYFSFHGRKDKEGKCGESRTRLLLIIFALDKNASPSPASIINSKPKVIATRKNVRRSHLTRESFFFFVVLFDLYGDDAERQTTSKTFLLLSY